MDYSTPVPLQPLRRRLRYDSCRSESSDRVESLRGRYRCPGPGPVSFTLNLNWILVTFYNSSPISHNLTANCSPIDTSNRRFVARGFHVLCPMLKINIYRCSNIPSKSINCLQNLVTIMLKLIKRTFDNKLLNIFGN